MPLGLQASEHPRGQPPRIRTLGRQLASQLRLSCRIASINWYCSGYTRALALVLNRWLPRLKLRPDQFVLVVTATRISQITDYSCNQTGGLFGDLATATLLAPKGSHKYPVRFELLYASAEKQPTPDVYFNYEMRTGVLTPTADGGQRTDGQRLVFSLDCMGIADTAPRAMANALGKAIESTKTKAGDIRTVLPHQAGAGITRLTAMKIEELGVHGEVINGLTNCVGNVSSSSIAYGLAQHWSQLSGIIACPAAGVGSPGRAEVSQGCILLRANPS
jgi:3-oxoacyl-[acyl-carrier-protein] synthase III